MYLYYSSGKPSYIHDRSNPDWAPTLKLDSFTPRKSQKKLKQANADFDRYFNNFAICNFSKNIVLEMTSHPGQ